ncbi:MAG: adenosylhomocysteinase [Acidobacteriota bacterium]|nr:adenosylhomocysteinase [Acidobacteriota bacterium]
MPVLGQIAERFAKQRPLRGVRVGACLHITAETASLVGALVDGGAQVALCAANPLSTQDDVAAALRQRGAVEVHGARGESASALAAHVRSVIDGRPQVVLDDGADLLVGVHEQRGDGAEELLGGMEETAAGLLRVRALEAERGLRCPVLAVNEARSERAFNDHYGTGQSTIDGILRATNILLAGRTVVVLGFGYTGRGIALRARGAGASVIVCEVDSIRALEARMAGYQVMPALEAAERGDVFVTVTGGRDALRSEHFERMQDGAVLANAGHFDVEIDLVALRALAAARAQVLPLVEQHTLADGRRLNLLAEGRVVNLVAGDGHPAAVMDISFGLQALCVEHLASESARLGPAVHAVPEWIDAEIARLKLDSLGVRIDELTYSQRIYRRAWER